ncbi:MAG: hypothetical protein H6604_01220 [Flavobacteriales bacterium]|nr:hypothetical protein [Flavobacteriales bacterium]
MKHLFLLSLFMIGIISYAQPNPEKFEQRKEQFKKKLAEDLNLTPDQIKKVEAIDAKYSNEEKALLEQRKNTNEKLKAIHQKKKQELDNILTKEQKEKFAQMRQEMKSKRKGKKGECSQKNKAECKHKKGDMPPPPIED